MQLGGSGATNFTLKGKPLTKQLAKKVAELPLENAAFYNKQNILKSLLDWFENWQDWQKRLIIATLIKLFSPGKLRLLKSAFESVFHKDFPSKNNAKSSYFFNYLPLIEKKGVDVSALHGGLKQIYKNSQVFVQDVSAADQKHTSFDRAQWLLDHYNAMVQQYCYLGKINLCDISRRNSQMSRYLSPLAAKSKGKFPPIKNNTSVSSMAGAMGNVAKDPFEDLRIKITRFKNKLTE